MTTVKADIAAADRVLTAAVRKARAQIADGDTRNVATLNGHSWSWRAYDREAVLDMLTAAVTAADVLLEARP